MAILAGCTSTPKAPGGTSDGRERLQWAVRGATGSAFSGLCGVVFLNTVPFPRSGGLYLVPRRYRRMQTRCSSVLLSGVMRICRRRFPREGPGSSAGIAASACSCVVTSLPLTYQAGRALENGPVRVLLGESQLVGQSSGRRFSVRRSVARSDRFATRRHARRSRPAQLPPGMGLLAVRPRRGATALQHALADQVVQHESDL